MNFSLGTFNDLLSEFQKYLSDRVPKPIYYVLGLVVSALAAIVGYIGGWANIMNTWNRADIFYKAVLTAGAVLVFLIVAFALGSLQSAVERWFQGNLPFRLLERLGRLDRHRRIWQARSLTFHRMTGLYRDIKDALEEVTEWGLISDKQPVVLQTAYELPHYHTITHKDLKFKAIDEVPTGSFQKFDDVVGTMTRHPLGENVVVTKADLVQLPDGMKDVSIIAFTVLSELVPTGLVPGDNLVIYPHPNEANLVSPLKPSLLIEMRQVSRKEANGAETDLSHLTLAIPAQNIDQFINLPLTRTFRVVRVFPPYPPMIENMSQDQQEQSADSIKVALEGTRDNKSLTEEIKALGRQLEEANNWLRRLQAGHIELYDIRNSLKAIAAVFSKLDSLRNDSGRENTAGSQISTWWSQANNYRNEWIQLLQNALSEVEYRLDQSHKFFYLYYPNTLSAVASTAIGNVFRAVDSYCDTLYGLDTTLVLPRLQAVMEPSTRSQLSKAHEQVALLEWLYLGSLTIGILGVAAAFGTLHYSLGILLFLLIFPLPQLILYPAIVVSSLDYAIALRLAYDRERGKVITTMGLSLPSSLDQDQEKALWKRIQQWWEYGVPPGNYRLDTDKSGKEHGG